MLYLLLYPLHAFGYEYTNGQIDMLSMAYVEGDKIGLAETTQAIVFQESLAGKYGVTKHGIMGDDGTSFGAGQMQAKTSWEILHKYPELIVYVEPRAIDWSEEQRQDFITKMPNRELIPHLLKNHRFNLALVAHNLLRHTETGRKLGLTGKELWRRVVRAHNAGWNGSRTRGYSYQSKVVSYLNMMRKLNTRVRLTSKKSPPLW